MLVLLRLFATGPPLDRYDSAKCACVCGGTKKPSASVSGFGAAPRPLLEEAEDGDPDLAACGVCACACACVCVCVCGGGVRQG
jgi:hypothetical protein